MWVLALTASYADEVRGYFLAANVVEPAPNGRTRLTLLTQIDPMIAR